MIFQCFSNMIKKIESDNEIDFCTLLKKAKSELHLSNADILQLPSVQSLLNQRKGHQTIIIKSFLFLMFVCFPITVIWSIRNGTQFGYYFAKM